MKSIYIFYKMLRKFSADNMPIYAASAAFWIMISAVPFLMLILTTIQFVPGLDRGSVLRLLIDAAPDMPQFRDMMQSLTDNLFVAAPTAMLSFSAVLTLWSASTGVYGIERGVRRLCGTEQSSGYFRMRCEAMLFTLSFLLSVLLTLFLLVLGGTIEALVTAYLPLVAPLVSYILGMKLLISVCFLFATFLFFYRFMPGRTAFRLAAWPGALFVSIGWVLLSYAFSIYFTYFKNISYMYGSLGAIVLLMFWLYAVICMVFFGAEVNLFYSALKQPAPKKEQAVQ